MNFSQGRFEDAVEVAPCNGGKEELARLNATLHQRPEGVDRAEERGSGAREGAKTGASQDATGD